VKLTSVGFLQPKDDTFVVPNPSFDGTRYEQTVESAHPETLQVDSALTPPKNTVVYPKEGPLDMQVYAQKHRDGYTYVAGVLRTDKPDAKLRINGIHRVYWTSPDDGSTKLFIGRRKGAGKVQIVSKDRTGTVREAKVIKANERGSDTAKLWAHQRLVQADWMNRRDVLNISLKYQIPSSQTALLAVPQEQMKLFKEKAAEYRRQQAEEARRERAWQRDRRQNWSRSSGGDPEIRVYEPQATRVYAMLPDGRSFDLTKSRGGFWGGNYDIPADAPEGEYVVKIYAVNAAAETTEQSVSYQVDRTAPTGTLRMEDGFLVLSSEKDLAKVVVVFGDGKEENMVQVEPGLYKLATGARRIVKVMMIDQAHNLGEVRWSN
jgi:hypothetical protein